MIDRSSRTWLIDYRSAFECGWVPTPNLPAPRTPDTQLRFVATERGNFWSDAFLYFFSVKPKFHLARHVTKRHAIYNPCILAVSNLSDSTARHAHHDALDTSNAYHVPCRDVTKRAKWNLSFTGRWGAALVRVALHGLFWVRELCY